MKIHLHKNATTTPAQRAFIQNNPDLSTAALAEMTGASKTTIRRWRNRTDVFDRSHAPKKITTALTPMEEIKIVLCRMATRAGLDDLHRMARSFLDINCSRASLNRCLKRYAISRLPSLKHAAPVDLSNFTGSYLFYTCFHLPSFSEKGEPVLFHTLLDCTFKTFHAGFSDSVTDFLSRQVQSLPLRVLGIIYTDPIDLSSGNADSQQHAFAVEHLCRSSRLSAFFTDIPYPKAAQKLAQAIAGLGAKGKTTGWELPWSSNDELRTAISRYNTRFPLGALKQKTPWEALEVHYTHFPNSFRQKPQNYFDDKSHLIVF